MQHLRTTSPRCFVVSGASGLIGHALCKTLAADGHIVKRLVRDRPKLNSTSEIYWNPQSGHIESQALERADVVVHLAGESLAGYGPWTKNKKRKILESRVKGTKLLTHALSRLRHPPKLLLSASAVGIYGNRDDELLTEDSHAGVGFLADVCKEWERATKDAKDAQIVTTHLRFGLVLSPRGGILKQLLPLYKLGLCPYFGSGQQYMSWVSIDDVMGAIFHIINHGSKEEAVNVCTPNPVTNYTFADTLARTLGRKHNLRVPETLLNLMLGKAGANSLTDSIRATPKNLIDSNFKFAYPELEGALSHLMRN